MSISNVQKIYDEITKIESKIAKLNYEISNDKREIERLEDSLHSLNSEIKSAVSLAKSDHLNGITAPLERSIRDLKEKINKLKEKQFPYSEQDMKENFLSDKLNSYEIVETCHKIVDMVEEENLSNNDLFKDPNVRLEQVLNEPETVVRKLRSMVSSIEFVSNDKLLSSYKIFNIVVSPVKYFGSLGAILYLLYLICIITLAIDQIYLSITFTAFTIGLLALGFLYNSIRFVYYRNYSLSILGAIDTIDSIFEEDFLKFYKKEVEYFNKTTDERIATLKDDLKEAEDNLNNLNTDDDDFDVTTSGPVQQLKNRKKEYLDKVDRLKEEIKSKEEEIKKLLDTKFNLDLKLKEGLDTVMSYNVKPENFKLPTHILYDDNPCRTVPLKREINIFAYKDFKTYHDFINLVIAQILMNTNVLNISFTIMDTVRMGQDVITFFFDEDLFKFLYTDAEITKNINDNFESFHRFMPEIRGQESLDDFNDYMVSIDSLTKDYRIAIFIEPELDKLKSKEMIRMHNTAKLSGVIPFVFLDYNNIDWRDVKTKDIFSKYGSSLSILSDGNVVDMKLEP